MTDVIGVADHVDVSNDEVVEVVMCVFDSIKTSGGGGFEVCTEEVEDEVVVGSGDGVIVELVEGV